MYVDKIDRIMSVWSGFDKVHVCTTKILFRIFTVNFLCIYFAFNGNVGKLYNANPLKVPPFLYADTRPLPGCGRIQADSVQYANLKKY